MTEGEVVQYRSFADMSQIITRNLHMIPNDVDLVVGIPRSGILPAITISLMLNVRYADLDRFLEGRLSGAGSTKQHSGLISNLQEARHVLVVDDSLNRGCAMRAARERLSHLYKDVKFTFAAIYVVPDGRDEVDIAFEVVRLPRIFEWNFIHHVYLEDAFVDIDGVLCRDPLACEKDDGPAYLRFLESAEPLYRPTRSIACLVTTRPEKYRPQTEAWLARCGIAYDRLIMHDPASTREPPGQGRDARFKGEAYRDSKAMLFIESEHAQALEIARISGKSVLSVERNEMVNPSAWGAIAAVQKLRNFDVNARMSDSPLNSRHAFKRRLKNMLPRSARAPVRAMASYFLKGMRGDRSNEAAAWNVSRAQTPPGGSEEQGAQITGTAVSTGSTDAPKLAPGPVLS